LRAALRRIGLSAVARKSGRFDFDGGARVRLGTGLLESVVTVGTLGICYHIRCGAHSTLAGEAFLHRRPPVDLHGLRGGAIRYLDRVVPVERGHTRDISAVGRSADGAAEMGTHRRRFRLRPRTWSVAESPPPTPRVDDEATLPRSARGSVPASRRRIPGDRSRAARWAGDLSLRSARGIDPDPRCAAWCAPDPAEREGVTSWRRSCLCMVSAVSAR